MAENTLEPLAILNGDNQALDLVGLIVGSRSDQLYSDLHPKTQLS